MDPAALIPAPDAIPVPWGFFQFLLILTFFAHLLLMNAMLGSAFIGLVRELRTPEGGPPPCPEIAQNLPYTIAFTVNFGVAPLLFLQVLYGHFMYTSSILMAAYWLSIIGMLILAYYSAYLYQLRPEMTGKHRRLALGGALLLLMAIAFLFVNNMTLLQTPAAWGAYFARPQGTTLNLGEPTLLSRYLHFLVASVAVGGLLQAILAWFRRKRGEAGAGSRLSAGMKWFTYATAVEAGTGIPFLFAMPREVHGIFVGGAPLPTLIFVAALLTTFLSLSFGAREKVWPATAAMAATVLLMILMRELARQAYLAPYFHPADLPLTAQWSPMLLFFVVLVAGIAAVVFMLRLAARSVREVRP